MDNSLFTITNDCLKAVISTKAAEVHSLKTVNDEYDYVWSGDEKYWSGRNPILFPQVSSTDNKTTLIDGVYYPIGNHGFARHSIFNVEDKKQDEITLSLIQNEDTLKQYPYNFKLTVNYKLQGKKLLIKYTIKNNSDKNMPYGFGLHPAFNCPLDYKDTKVIFDEKEENYGNEITISKQLFEEHPTVCIDKPSSCKATLCSGKKKISVNYKGFKIFAIWSKGPFVCLEPWMNETDEDHTIEMKDRKGYTILSPNQEDTIEYSWEIEA